VLISDGDEEESYDDIATRFDCTLVRGTHLYSLETCHLYVLRLLRHLVDGEETYLLKIDPDTLVSRPIGALPTFSSLFGTLETITEGWKAEIRVPANVQGGCIGMTRDAAVEIFASGLLTHDNCAIRHKETWARCIDMERCAANDQFCDDFVLSWAAYMVGIPIVECSEIRSRWRRPIDNAHDRYAITHPHKLLDP
jgi:hypothetical protein